MPYELLPQLEFLTRADYQHAYYVDLPLKVAHVRTFTPDADHPNGWGTILIGGFRMGGSCGACPSGTGAPPMTVSISGTNYTFYSSYFAIDVTNPDAPKLLWSFSSPDMGVNYQRAGRRSSESCSRREGQQNECEVVHGRRVRPDRVRCQRGARG